MSEEKKPPRSTNASGVPVGSDEHSLTAGPNGPTVLHDAYTVQKMQQVAIGTRRRTPRVVGRYAGIQQRAEVRQIHPKRVLDPVVPVD
ncbi:MAG TPA: hypothetical protein VF752_00295 [Thermoleophilaceae bacterium]